MLPVDLRHISYFIAYNYNYDYLITMQVFSQAVIATIDDSDDNYNKCNNNNDHQ